VNNNEFDVIVVGSGAAGATLARELTKRNLKVLLLERGADKPLSDSVSGIASVVQEFPVWDGVKAATAFNVGGSTSIYFGVCKLPTAETYERLGFDLSEELEEVQKELPISKTTEEFLAPQSIPVVNSAKQLGYPMKFHMMTIDKSKCPQGRYSYEAKWKATGYIEEAVAKGAALISKATVQRIIVENGQAVGVEYKHKTGILGGRLCKAYAKKIVLSAGSPATPKLLIDCGIKNVGSRGFFCKPGFMVFGTIPGLKAKDAFLGMTEHSLGNGVTIGDGALTSSLYKLYMLGNRRFSRVFSFETTVAVAVSLNDELSGEVNEKGEYFKRLTPEQTANMESAGELAVKILKHAGAVNIFRGNPVVGTPSGVLWVNEHLDENLQTKIGNLYVCDQSAMTDPNVTPLITIVCMAKRLAKHLARSLSGQAGEDIAAEKAA